MTKLLNIATLGVAATAAIHVKNAAGEPLYADDERTLPVRIIVHSPGSKAYGVVEARQTARVMKRANDNDGKFTAATPEERIVETAEDLASITVAFENFTYGENLTGEELYRAVYLDPALGFIVKQVNKFSGEWGNFSAASKAA